MNRHILWTSALTLPLMIGMPECASSQTEKNTVGLSGELAVGAAMAGHGGGFAGKAAMRVHPGSGDWVVGVRFTAADGTRRETTDCIWYCNPIESLSEAAALLYRTVPLSDSDGVVYLGAGIGRLTGRQFIGDTSELEDIGDTGLSVEAALHAPRHGFRVVLAAQGHFGSTRPLVGATIGLAFGR